MRQALLVMDVQEGVVSRFAGDEAPLLSRLAGAVRGARAASVPVIYVTVSFRPGAPEISPNNRTFSALAAAGGFEEQSPATAVHHAVSPGPGDIVVTKKRVSAFAGSDLDPLLRSLGVSDLALSGIATSGVVLSTLRQAADLDYGLTVLADGCADQDEEVHRLLLEKVFPRQATVLSCAEWLATLKEASGESERG